MANTFYGAEERSMAYAKGEGVHFPDWLTILCNPASRKCSPNVRVIKQVEIPILHKYGYTAQHIEVQIPPIFTIRILVS